MYVFYSPQEHSRSSYWTLEIFWRSSPSIIKNVFHFKTKIPYNLRSRSELYSRNPKAVKYETETISYSTPKVSSLVPNAIKSRKSLHVFKSKIRQWEPDCPCRLCKNYLQHVGFIYFSGNYFFKSTPNIMYLIRFEPMLLSCFSVSRFIAPYVDISGINC